MGFNISSRRGYLAAVIGLVCLFAASATSAATVASITLTETSKTLIAGKSETIKATAKDSKGHAITGVKFTWSSSSTKVLSVSSTTGSAKGLFPGVSTVKVSGGGKTASVAITVVVASITLSESSKTLQVGSHETIKATAKNSAGKVISGVTFRWTSSATPTVKVGSTGIATAQAVGTATIKATVGSKSAGVLITVSEPALSTASGTAATGAAVAGATITLVDARGQTVSTTTAGDGTYTLSTAALVPPFMVSVQVDDTTTLYSVSDGTSSSLVINVTPLTDLIIRSWYSVQGKDVATAFTAPATNPPPSPTEVQIIGNVVVQVTALWLQQNGVDTSNFSFVSTPFTADSTGVDAVLDITAIDSDTGAITISDGTTTQDSTVTYGDGAMTVDTSTSGPGGDSSSQTGTVVATTSDTQAALTGITSTLTSFANTVNAKGSALKASDLSPYVDSGLINEGLNKNLFTDNTADDFNGIQTGGTPVNVSFQVLNIQSLDTTHGLADVNFTMTETAGDQSQVQTAEFFFKKQSNGSWLFDGNQLPAHLDVQSEARTNQGANPDTNGPDINVDIRPIQGAYSSITIDGGGVFTSTDVTKSDLTDVSVFIPDPASPTTTVEVDRDEFFVKTGVLADLIPAGTDMTITMTPTGGSPVQYHVKTNAFTTELISITNLSDSTLSTGAKLGNTLHVEWTLPKTFAIAEVKLDGQVFTTTNDQCSGTKPILSVTATSGDITLPASCKDGTINAADLNLNVIGVNGERELVIYQFQDP